MKKTYPLWQYEALIFVCTMTIAIFAFGSLLVYNIKMRAFHDIQKLTKKIDDVLELEKYDILDEIALDNHLALSAHLQRLSNLLSIDKMWIDTKPQISSMLKFLGLSTYHNSEILSDFNDLRVLIVSDISNAIYSQSVTPLIEESVTMMLMFLLIMFLLLFIIWMSSRNLIIKPLKIEGSANESKILEVSEILHERENAKRALRERSTLEGLAKSTEILAHDIRKPFSAIACILKIINQSEDPAKLKATAKFLPEVERSMQNVNMVIDDILTFRGTSSVKLEEVCPFRVIVESLEIALSSLSRVDVSFKYEKQTDRNILCDSRKITRVIVNLISNAINATKGKCEITFSVADTGQGFTKIAITNSGSEIPQDKRQYIFSEFISADGAGSNGLGLAICKNLIEAHGGQIGFESEPTKTAFFFTVKTAATFLQPVDLPKHSSDISLENKLSDVRQIAVPLVPVDLHREVRIMIVDDEPIYWQFIANLKSSFPPSIREKIEIVFDDGKGIADDERSFDIYIIDVDLGYGSGFELLEHLTKTKNSSVFCIHSNRGLIEYQQKSMVLGAHAFLAKPMTANQFAELLNLGTHRPQ